MYFILLKSSCQINIFAIKSDTTRIEIALTLKLKKYNMARLYAEKISGTSGLMEGQEIICRVKGTTSGDGFIEYEPILDGGNYIDPKDDMYPDREDIYTGDYLIFEYVGGTAFKFVGLEKA